jgi:hypothetical protein
MNKGKAPIMRRNIRNAAIIASTVRVTIVWLFVIVALSVAFALLAWS